MRVWREGRNDLIILSFRSLYICVNTHVHTWTHISPLERSSGGHFETLNYDG